MLICLKHMYLQWAFFCFLVYWDKMNIVQCMEFLAYLLKHFWLKMKMRTKTARQVQRQKYSSKSMYFVTTLTWAAAWLLCLLSMLCSLTVVNVNGSFTQWKNHWNPVTSAVICRLAPLWSYLWSSLSSVCVYSSRKCELTVWLLWLTCTKPGLRK